MILPNYSNFEMVENKQPNTLLRSSSNEGTIFDCSLEDIKLESAGMIVGRVRMSKLPML